MNSFRLSAEARHAFKLTASELAAASKQKMRNYLLPIFLSALSATSALSAVRTSCPFVGGTAVYKARVLWATYNPIIQYNDRLNCIQNIDQNKNGNNEYINLDSLLEAQVNEQSQKSAEQIKNISTNHLNIKSQIKLKS